MASLDYDGTQGRCTRLEELCLRGNGLGISSLRALTPIIRLACNDFRDLDLSGNDFSVNTEDDVAIWEGFLKSFEECWTLRRIDLSGNALGPRAFEVLIRVYARADAVDLLIPHSEITEDEAYNDGDTAHQVGPVPCYATTHGLRSVPYLVFSDTAMTDICALHLSFLIATHHTPAQLLPHVPTAKAGIPANQILAYDEDPRCRGIIYHPNVQLGNAGLRVLELAERRRVDDVGAIEMDDRSPERTSESSKSPRRASGSDSKSFVTVVTKRRRSTAHKGFPDREDEADDLHRARARIQGDTLQDPGPKSDELWWSALKLLALCRNIQPQIGKMIPPPASRVKLPIIKTLTISGSTTSKNLAPLIPPIPLMKERDPNQKLKPWNLDFRKQNGTTHPRHHIVPPTLPTRDTEAERPTSAAEPPISMKAAKDYRTRLPCGFSEDAWRRIMAYRVGAMSILSDRQQFSILRWAMDRKTLVREREALGLTFATQIWRVLEGTGCLTYDMDSD